MEEAGAYSQGGSRTGADRTHADAEVISAVVAALCSTPLDSPLPQAECKHECRDLSA